MEALYDITFQNATKEDIAKIVQIEKQCFGDAWSEDAFNSCLISPFYEMVVALLQDEIIAYGVMKCMYEDGELVRIAVSPLHRRKGVGKKLLMWLLKIAGHNGVENVFLDVRESNRDAVLLYEKIGFTSYEITKDFYSDPKESSIKMRKNI